jgi:hypothetical protein
LLIHKDFSVSHRAKTTLDDANSVPKTHLVLGMIFLTVVPLPTQSTKARSRHSGEFFCPVIRALL